MQEQDKILSREQLIGEMVKICQRVAELEASGTAHDRDRELELLNRAGQEFATTLDMQQITDQLLQNLSAIRSDGNIQPLPVMNVQKHSLGGGEMAVVEVFPKLSDYVAYRHGNMEF